MLPSLKTFNGEPVELPLTGDEPFVKRVIRCPTILKQQGIVLFSFYNNPITMWSGWVDGKILAQKVIRMDVSGTTLYDQNRILTLFGVPSLIGHVIEYNGPSQRESRRRLYILNAPLKVRE